MSLTIKPKDSCAFDQVSLGEIMLRLDPGEGRIRTARQFTAWEGGGGRGVEADFERTGGGCGEQRGGKCEVAEGIHEGGERYTADGPGFSSKSPGISRGLRQSASSVTRKFC